MFSSRIVNPQAAACPPNLTNSSGFRFKSSNRLIPSTLRPVPLLHPSPIFVTIRLGTLYFSLSFPATIPVTPSCASSSSTRRYPLSTSSFDISVKQLLKSFSWTLLLVLLASFICPASSFALCSSSQSMSLDAKDALPILPAAFI